MLPEIVIDIGGITGIYGSVNLYSYVKEIWRITENFEYKTRLDRKLTNLLIGREKTIYKELTNDVQSDFDYYQQIKTEAEKVSYPELPLSMPLICQNFAKFIPENSSLHLAILRPLEFMTSQELPKSVDVMCNVGGFGIDGPLSAAFGQSLADKNRKVFCFIGDLAFFYDMNILGNRDLKKNFRILLENNNESHVMRSNPVLNDNFGDKCKVMVSAGGHYINGAKGWVESCGFKYMSARTKEEFLAQIDDFCNKDFDKPVLFEVFTTLENNLEANKEIGRHYASIFNYNYEYPNTNTDCSFFENIFSVRNEFKKDKKYKVVRFMGIKMKFSTKKNSH